MESIVSCCDCMEFMKDFPDGFFELAIVDPPYGIGKTWTKNRKGEKSFKGSYKNETPPNNDYFNELLRVSKNQIIWGGTSILNAGLQKT